MLIYITLYYNSITKLQTNTTIIQIIIFRLIFNVRIIKLKFKILIFHF